MATAYDYDAATASIAHHLQAAAEAMKQEKCDTADTATDKATATATIAPHWERALEEFEQLSIVCPLTPRLWLAYAQVMRNYVQLTATNVVNTNDARALQQQLLQLGLEQFPGSAVLQYALCMSSSSSSTTTTDTEQQLLQALQWVGRGSHRNESAVVHGLWRQLMELTQHSNSSNDTNLASVVELRARTPMRNANDGIEAEYLSIMLSNSDATTVVRIQQARQWQARTFDGLVTYEDEITARMHQEGILWEGFLATNRANNDNDSDDWNRQWQDLISNPAAAMQSSIGMGVGGPGTVKAFLDYARACRTYTIGNSNSTEQDDDDDDDAEQRQAAVRDLATPIYERAIAECPTSEAIWMAYLDHLHGEHDDDKQTTKQSNPTVPAATQLAVAIRATRNCPYSLSLAQRRIRIAAQAAGTALDADALLHQHVDPVVALGFLTKARSTTTAAKQQQPQDKPSEQDHQILLKLHWTVIQQVQLHIWALTLRGTSFGVDDWESPPKKNNQQQSRAPKKKSDEDDDDDDDDELKDWLEDLHDLYETILKRTASAAARAWLHYQRARIYELVVQPLQNTPTATVTNRWESALRAHNPPHPRIAAARVRHFIGSVSDNPHNNNSSKSSSTPQDVGKHLIQTRGWYRQSIRRAPKPAASQHASSSSWPGWPDATTALQQLGQEWLEWETTVGSVASYKRAHECIQHKLQQSSTNETPSRTSSEATAPVEDNGNPELEHAPESVPSTTKKRPLESVDEDASSAPAHQQQPPAAKIPKIAADVEQAPPEPMKDVTMEADTSSSAPDTTTATITSATMTATTNIEKRPQKSKFHGFTIRVSDLGLETTDADVADLFRARCGALVHVRIVRDKSQPDRPSKGWALVQFEERSSVEQALAFSGQIGLHERLVTIDRSLYPAVDVLPPGRHRVSAPGQGRVSKRNQKRKALSREEPSTDGDPGNDAGSTPSAKAHQNETPPVNHNDNKKKSSTAGAFGILDFRPRGVQRKARKGRTKIDLTDKK